MKFTTTILLAVMVILTGLGIWWFDLRLNDGDRRNEGYRALRFQPDEIVGITLISEGQTFKCERSEDGWKLIEPVEGRADEVAVNRLLAGLERLKLETLITAEDRFRKGLRLADYGLEEPRGKVVVDDGFRQHTLLLGEDLAFGDAVYVQLPQRSEIYSVNRQVWTLMPHTAEDLRDHTFFEGAAEQVRQIELKTASGFYTMKLDELGDWWMREPVVSRIDPAPVNDLLDRVFGVRILDFMADDVTEPAAYGLDEITDQVSFFVGERGVPQTLLLGKAVEGKAGMLYARQKDGASIFGLPTSILESLRRPLDEWRNRNLIGLGLHEINRIQLSAGANRVTMVRDEADAVWRLDVPRSVKADGKRVENLVQTLTSARITEFVDGEEAEKGWASFANGVLNVVVAAALPEEEQSIFGSADSFSGVRNRLHMQIKPEADTGTALVRLVKEDVVLRVARTLYDACIVDPLFYRDREMLQVPRDTIVKVTLEQQGAPTQVIIRDRLSGAWQARDPGLVVQSNAVENVLFDLSLLRAQELIEINPKDLEAYGLSQPRALLTIGLTRDAGLARVIEVGKNTVEGTSCYAMVRGQDVVFLLPDDVRDRLVHDLVQENTKASR